MERRYEMVVSVARLLCRLFFRRIEVVGLENVPRDRGGVLVSWHPNGVINPGIILATFPSQITFGARDGLFRVPLFGALLRAAGAVPILRAQDQSASLSSEARRTPMWLHSTSSRQRLSPVVSRVCSRRGTHTTSRSCWRSSREQRGSSTERGSCQIPRALRRP